MLLTPEQIAASGSEHAHQAAAMQWVAIEGLKRYANLDLLFAIPNGGDRKASVAASLRACLGASPRQRAGALPDSLPASSKRPSWTAAVVVPSEILVRRVPDGESAEIAFRDAASGTVANIIVCDNIRHVPFVVREYIAADGTSPFRRWLTRLAVDTRARIQARVFRFESGNLGDHEALGDGV